MESQVHRNIIYRVIEALVSVAVSISQFTLLTRYLSQEDVGKYSLLLACMFFLNALSYVFGIMSVVTRDITQDKDPRQIISSAFFLQLGIALVLAAVLLPLILTLEYFAPIREGLLVATIAYLVMVSPLSFQAILNAQQKMGQIAVINIIAQLVSLGLLITFVFMNASLFCIYLAYMSLNMVQAVLTVFLLNGGNTFLCNGSKEVKLYQY